SAFIVISTFSDSILGATALFTAFALAMGQTDKWGGELSIFALFVGGIVGVRAMFVSLTQAHALDTDDITSSGHRQMRGGYGALDVDQSTGGNSTGGVVATSTTNPAAPRG